MSPPSLSRSLLYLTAGAIGIFAITDSDRDKPIVEAARQAFDAYQDALFSGDRRGLRRVLAASSREVVPHIPFERAQGQQRLTVVGAETRLPQVLLSVEDPNQGGRKSTYVLVKEDGELRLDLLATTAYNHEERPAAHPGPRFTPGELDPDQIAEIRSRRPGSFR